MSRRGAGQRIVGGRHPVRELLRAGHPVHRLLVAEGRDTGADDLVALARQAGIPVETTDRASLDRRTDGLTHQGVVALAPTFPYVRLETVLERIDAADDPALLVALDGVTDPHNLGSIARSAEAVGAHGLLLPERRSAAVTPVVEKTAAGALAHLPVVQTPNLVRALGELSGAGIWSLGLDASGDAELSAHPLAGEACVLVVGAEGRGLARLTRERCDALVRLPMRGHVASLNASVAAGVALYGLLARRAADAG